jgi:hypothetical protein
VMSRHDRCVIPGPSPQRSYVRNVFTGKPAAIVCSLARRAIRDVCARKYWHSSFPYIASRHLFGFAQNTLWIRPELPYRSRAGELTRGMLFSDQC